jgi:hypothetical protein
MVTSAELTGSRPDFHAARLAAAKDKKSAATGLGGLEGIEGFFRQVYVISPFYFFVSLVARGTSEKKKI